MNSSGTLISEIANCPKLRNVEYPPMIFPDVVDVACPARVLETAGQTIPMATPTRIIIVRAVMTVGERISRTIPTPMMRNPRPMMKNGLMTVTILLYIRDTTEFVTPWTPRNNPTIDADTYPGSSGSSRNVGILVGRRKDIVWQTKMAP